MVERFGRKFTLIAVSLPFMIGWSQIYYGGDVNNLYMGKIREVCHEKTDLKVFVVVIPKEGWVRRGRSRMRVLGSVAPTSGTRRRGQDIMSGAPTSGVQTSGVQTSGPQASGPRYNVLSQDIKSTQMSGLKTG